MRFHVLGLGSIGSLVAYHLRRTLPEHHPITLLYKTQPYVRQARIVDGIRVEHGGVTSTTTGFESQAVDQYAEMSHDMPYNWKGELRLPTRDRLWTRAGELPAGKSLAEADVHGGVSPIESLIVATKAHHVLEPLQRLLPRISSHSTIVLLQNGMGIYEDLIHKVFRNSQARPHFILASNTHGAWKKQHSHVVHAGIGQLLFGIVPDSNGRDFEASLRNESLSSLERLPNVEDILPSSAVDDPAQARYRSLRLTVSALLAINDLHTAWMPIDSMQTLMRRKLVVNSVINPLTALMGCRNGDVFTSDASRRILRRICQEATRVFSAECRASLGETSAANDFQVDDSLVPGLPPMLHSAALEVECLQIAQKTAGNYSSMLQDIRSGKSTEVNYLNGYLLKLGAAYEVQMPATATLLNLVKMRSDIPLAHNG